jgi:hypothetical protein
VANNIAVLSTVQALLHIYAYISLFFSPPYFAE